MPDGTGLGNLHHSVDLCVVGGGLAGVCAAIAAARRGVRVALVHDRPVLGGNASSEIRMWIGGAHGPHNRETGIIEELLLENFYRNPEGSWSIWDSVLYGAVRFEPNIELLLNCSVNGATCEAGRIRSVRAWQLTTYTWHTVEAELFADCSGDSILAPLTGAETRRGREAREEFDESIAPEQADPHVMGLSCLIQPRELPRASTYRPPSWAYPFESEQDLPNRNHQLGKTNFWWLELGGERDTIAEAEEIRDQLLPTAFGLWDHIKNRGDHGADRWSLDWVGFLPGKRESRRYIGDHILTQNDVRDEGHFNDLVAYGGWSMDDHHPAGLAYPGKPNIHHLAPSPYGIPYRCLYSRNVENLFCAGRNISTTHAALSSTRVMATCAVIGQAVGTAAAIAVREGLTPRGVYEHQIDALQQALMDDDCYLPWHRRAVGPMTAEATLSASAGDPEPLRNGLDRPIDDATNAWDAAPGESVELHFDAPRRVGLIRLVFDSDTSRGDTGCNMPCDYPLDREPLAPPPQLVRGFTVETRDEDGTWNQALAIDDNYQRLVRLPLEGVTSAVRVTPTATWGAETARLFAVDLL